MFRLAAPESAIDLKVTVKDLKDSNRTVVLDSLGEVMPLFGANSNNADDFSVVHTEVLKPLARAGAAVLVVNHLPKNAERCKHGPTGTVVKTRTVGGVAVSVSAEHAFRPGVGGTATLELQKDRHGGVRRLVAGGDRRPVIGTFTMSEHDGTLSYRFDTPSIATPQRRSDLDNEQAKRDGAARFELHQAGE